MTNNSNDREKEVLLNLSNLIKSLYELKPRDRSKKDRWFALTITQLQIAQAIFAFYINSNSADEENDEGIERG